MRLLTTVAEFRAARAQVKGSLGFVPTMGYLHQGHMELVRRARKENDTVAASIFVNPTQFGPSEDLAAYPRDFDRDRAMLEKEGCDLLFYPGAEEVYPPGFDTYIEMGRIAQPLEGVARPGHFRGVATVVAKLFNVVQPTRAYFGQKDGQQVAVVKKMVRDLDFPLEIVVVPTVREPDGLAMSSRNVYLKPLERQAATVLWRALSRARDLYERGERDAEALREEVRRVLDSEPLARTEYVSLADAETLEEVDHVTRPVMVSLVVRMGATRLIDNIILG
ncbi:MAG: pantoate--beta-alanine ligase [Chloroflexi bacterium]|nr:pantoate--beta-alanine ligase [Chloroflexota bacterium]